MMAQATIYRPSLESMIQEKIPFTALPNSLIHHGELGLKPRDASVLNYLLSKPASWNICPAAIANALYISVSTVRRALTYLVKLGIAGYSRFADGSTKWFVKLPDDFSPKPQHQKPHGRKPQVQDGCVLKQNDLLEMNNETTNNGSVVVSLPDYVNQTDAVKNELGALDAKLQAMVLKMLTDAMLCAGKIKSTPTAYLLGIVRNAAKGCFSSPKAAAVTAKPTAKPNNDLALVNLRNELANFQRLYELSPNESLLSQIQTLKEKLNQARLVA
jgi:hypothetical protein